MPVYNDIPTIEYYPMPEMAVRPLHSRLSITSILDVGSGRGGVFDQGYWDQRPMSRKETCDIHWLKATNGSWNMQVGVDVTQLTRYYEPKSFDMVQCMEVLEHVTDSRKALEQLCTVAKKFVLISSADEMHHIGEEQDRIEKINEAQKYIKQPSIKDLNELGFVVRVTSYNRRQIVAWKVFP